MVVLFGSAVVMVLGVFFKLWVVLVNDQIQVVVIGVCGIGGCYVGRLVKCSDVCVVVFCDVD